MSPAVSSTTKVKPVERPLSLPTPLAWDARSHEKGAPMARPAGAERGTGAPASDGDGGSGGAKPPGFSLVS
jgi:hypothetical protein